MLKSLSTSLIVRGILAVIVGIIALAWPSVTVLALVILFAVYAFMAAGLQAARAFSSRKAGPVLRAPAARAGRPGRRGRRAGLAGAHRAGPGADRGRLGGHRRPGGDRRRLRSGEAAGTRALFILGGLITAAFGVVLCARPGIGAVTLALLFGLFSLIAGIWMLVQGIELRRTGKTPDPAAREKTPA